jgi:hypothetical protein
MKSLKTYLNQNKKKCRKKLNKRRKKLMGENFPIAVVTVKKQI